MLEQDREDRAMVAALQDNAAAGPSLNAEAQIPDAAAAGARIRSKVKVVANLPYNITKEFLKLMLPKGDLISELSIMIQVTRRERKGRSGRRRKGRSVRRRKGGLEEGEKMLLPRGEGRLVPCHTSCRPNPGRHPHYSGCELITWPSFLLSSTRPPFKTSGGSCPATSQQDPRETRLPRDESQGALLL